ncbi:hypothetical protein [Mesobacillus subterraneus]|uniref:hypothetical protein n=1 Tax=Mesobacillus subterraneus TaxID=285983 RepID=UPI001CFDF79B|nr:hypothetical protein [Mesobacillus subterraneus]
MSIIKDMTDKNHNFIQKNVHHQGYDGQKPRLHVKKVSFIKDMTAKNHDFIQKSVHHQRYDGQKPRLFSKKVTIIDTITDKITPISKKMSVI